MIEWVSLKDGRRHHKPMSLQSYLETWKKWTQQLPKIKNNVSLHVACPMITLSLLGGHTFINSEETYSFTWVLKNDLQVKLTKTEYLSDCLMHSKGIILLGMPRSKCQMVTHVKITLLLYSTLHKPFNCF